MVDCLKVVIPLSSVGMVDTPGTAGVVGVYVSCGDDHSCRLSCMLSLQ